MEAPEKIYIQPNIGGRELIKTWFPVKIDQESIEYVRKDAFIERAAKWLDNNIWTYIEIMHPTVDSYTHINRERLIWDFKKVMRR